MIKILKRIREEVIGYLDCEYGDYPDELYAFYYRCMKAGMDMADADRYAALNTLFNYDIGMDNARAIDEWMYEHEYEIYELRATNPDDKLMVTLAVMELGLNLDFSGWIQEDYTEYKYFEL